MPRNSSGTYTLPAGNPVVPNTLIETTWANPTMADLGSSITDSLDRQGRGAMQAPLKLTDGTNVAPSLSFSSESTSGLYRIASNNLGVSIAGALVLQIAVAGVSIAGTLAVSGALAVVPGTAALPGYSFTGDPNTGMSAQVADTLILSTAGLARHTITPIGGHVLAAPGSGDTLTSPPPTAGNGAAVVSAAALSGGSVYHWVRNTSDTASSAAAFIVAVGGESAADPILRFDIGVVGVWTLGLDNSDSNALVISNASSLGTNNRLRITTAGNVSIPAPTSGDTLTLTAGAGGPSTINSIAGAAATDYALTLFTGTGATGFVGVGNSAVANVALRDTMGIGTQTADPFAILTGNLARVTVSAAGNVAIAAPASGTALAITHLASTSGIALTDGVRSSFWYEGAKVLFGSSSAHDLALYTNNAERIAIAAAGAVTINAPSSGQNLILTGSAGAFPQITNFGAAAAGATLYQLAGATRGYIGLDGGGILGTGTGTGFGIRSEAELLLLSGAGSFAIRYGAAGNLSIPVPSSGTALAIDAVTVALRLNSSAAGNAVDQYFLHAGTLASLMGNAGTAAQGIGDTAAGDHYIRVENHDLRISTNAGTTSALTVHSDGRVSGKFLHNVGTVTGTTNQYIASGTYTPTMTNGTNTTATGPVGTWRWQRVGNVVSVTGTFVCTSTAGAGATSTFDASLPIASNFVTAQDAGGCTTQSQGAGQPYIGGFVGAQTATDRFTVFFASNVAGLSAAGGFAASYVIL